MVWLQSKTTAPRTGHVSINRERLIQQLEQSHAAKFTIIQAPAGYGKTTIISQWLQQSGTAAAWFSIDSTDNDPVRFWTYFIQAIHEAVPKEVQPAIAKLLLDSSPIDHIVESLLNELYAINQSIAVVLDDFHLVHNATILDLFCRVITYLPSSIHIYATTRSALALPIASWQVKGWIFQLSVDDLRFTFEEFQVFYQATPLPQTYLKSIFEQTEGWAAGMQLAALANTAVTSKNSHSPIVEFFVEDILQSLTVEEQQFLQKTCMLELVTPALCDSILGSTKSAEKLQAFEQRGLFLFRLEQDEPAYRYHQLFSQALQEQFKKSQAKEIYEAHYVTVATYLEQSGDYIQAVALLLTNELFKEANEMMMRQAVTVFLSGKITTYRHWIRVLRQQRAEIEIELLVMYCISLSTVYYMEEAYEVVVELKDLHDTTGWMDEEQNHGLAAMFEMASAFILLAGHKRLDQAMHLIRKQVEQVQIPSTRWDHVPMQYNTHEASLLRTSMGARGRLWWPEEVMPLFALFQQTEIQHKNLTGFALGVSAEISYMRNNCNQSLAELDGALQYGYHFQDMGLILPMLILKCKLYAKNEQWTEAHLVLDQIQPQVKERHWLDTIRTMRASLYVTEGRIGEAKRELQHASGLDQQEAISLDPFWLITCSQWMIKEKQYEQALKQVLLTKEQAIQEGQMSTVIEATVVEMIAYVKTKQWEPAMQALQFVLNRGASYGYLQPFLLAVDVLRPLYERYLQQAGSYRENHSKHIEQILAQSPKLLQAADLVASLTPRERTVVELLQQGATNSEIATVLQLTEGTVRVYLSTIYSKLGVDSRTKVVLLLNEQE